MVRFALPRLGEAGLFHDRSLFLTRRIIHCCSLIPAYRNAVVDSLNELADELATHYPAIPGFDVVLLDEPEETIVRHLEQSMPSMRFGPSLDDSDLAQKRVFVLCDFAHPFIDNARSENPRAHWGIAVPMRFAVAWVNNPFLWWHEALHLFNAKDCYNKFGINKCRNSRCVMQASPTRFTCGDRLHLCSKNQRRLGQDPIL